MIEFLFLFIGIVIMISSCVVAALTRRNLALLIWIIGLLISIGPATYEQFVLNPSLQPIAESFCESMGMNYYAHYPFNFKLDTVECARQVDCPEHKCMLIIEKISFNYPIRIGKIIHD